MEVFEWIACEDDGSFSAFQCDPESRMCFCLHPNGTRVSRLIFRSNRVTAEVCMQGEFNIKCKRKLKDVLSFCRTSVSCNKTSNIL